MAEHSDRSPEATKLAHAQALRLRRFRSTLTPIQADAARAAGVGKDVWNRMELGETRINAVALARFCDAYEVPTEYVMTGRFTGLEESLVRALVLLESEEAGGPRAVARSKGTSERARSGSCRTSERKGMSDTQTKAASLDG